MSMGGGYISTFCAFFSSDAILASTKDILRSRWISSYGNELVGDSLVVSVSCSASGLESRKYRVCSMADPFTNGGNIINRPREFVSRLMGPL